MLLLAIGLIQVYGQLRTQRYKESADAEIRGIAIDISRIGTGVDQLGAGINQQGSDLRNIATQLNSFAADLIEEEEEGEEEGKSS